MGPSEERSEKDMQKKERESYAVKWGKGGGKAERRFPKGGSLKTGSGNKSTGGA